MVGRCGIKNRMKGSIYMFDINLNNLNNRELVETAEAVVRKYEAEKATGNTYVTIQGKDLVMLSKSLQRAVFEGVVKGDPRPKVIHDKVNELLANDFSMRGKEKKSVKSLYDIEREQNGWGRYGNTIAR